MSGESSSAAEAAAPNLNLTAEEKRVYGQLFRQADSDSVGVVTGEIAVKFFEKTRLDSRILGEIWQIADRENRGFLTPAGFGIVLRLIGHAQAGREPTPELALQNGPIPRFDGLVGPPAVSSPAVAPLQAQGTGGGPIRIPPLTPEKVAQYTGLFEHQAPPGAGVLPGDSAKQIFEKSGLPNDILGKIWQLADTEQRGGLVLTEFVIAMHLLASVKTGALRGLPNILPAALYEAATRRPPSRQSPTGTGPGPISAIPRQLSGTAQVRTGSPLGRPPLAPQATGLGADWLVTPLDKAKFDQLYENLDKDRKGFITGEEAVPFLSQSNLPEDTLAQIWDLADFTSEGRLTRDTFAVAMYLIRQQRMRRDGSLALPPTLPPNLIPPSMRNQVRPPTANSAFDIPPPQPPAAPKSALDDLFGLDASPTPPPPAPAQTALSTGGSAANDPFAGGPSILSPSSPAKPSPTTTTFKPFVPSSSFGRGLTVQSTGGSSGSAPGLAKSAMSAPITEDLLGDNDPEVSKKLTSETAELANLSSQVGTLSKQMQEVQAQRTAAQNELNQATAQKKNFENRLSQLRSLYEKEAQDVRSLEEQLSTARKDTQKLQGECISLEGSYRDLQNQHQQVLSGLQADQQENANLKEKIRTVNAEIAQIKPTIDKLKSEARQQKGLVAINKKQLATSESERDKLKLEAENLAKSNEEAARQANSSSPPVPPVSSPTPSTASGNNPFFRRTGSTDLMGAFASPPIKPFNDKSFDDVFGPSFPPPGTANTPPPPTSFKQQDTGTSSASVASFATPVSTTAPPTRQPTLATDGTMPPESKPINAAFLAFPDPPESLTSSRQVSPPMSRSGEKDLPSTDATPGLSPLPTEALVMGSGLGLTAASASLAETKTTANGSATAPAEVSPGRDDPFAAVDLQAKAKADFDNAFASFNSLSSEKKPDTSNAFSAFDVEFPPIAELERDEDTDSASEQGGFDDDFAPASPQAKTPSKSEATKEPEPLAASTAPASAFPAITASTASSGITEPDQITEKPKSPTAPFGNATIVGAQSHVDDIFGPPPPAAAPIPAPVAPSVPAKAPFDDLDDDFEGLEDAKEGSADDDFATISRSGLDDFNPVFDSSPPMSQAKSDSTAFGVESSFDFGSVSANSTTGAPASVVSATASSAPGVSAKAPAPSAGHDWDAIFADLDSPADSTTTATTPAVAPAPVVAAAPVAPAATNEPPRPNPLGRALTEEGLHDDPILKNLTSMGYSRADAVLALEKYDYNLERAANYLASQS